MSTRLLIVSNWFISRGETKCAKCDHEFVLGEEIVVKRHNTVHGHCHTKKYHRLCYTDGRGNPIYE